MAAGGCVSESLHVCVELKNSSEFQEIEMWKLNAFMIARWRERGKKETSVTRLCEILPE